MSTAIAGLLSQLVERRDRLRETTLRQLEQAERAGITEMTPAHHQALSELEELDRRIQYQRDELERCGLDNPVLSRIASAADSQTRKITMDQNLTYRKHDRRTSWVRDLVMLQSGNDDTGECRSRLMRHASEVASEPAFAEYRDLSRVDGSGGYAVPPAWLMDQYVALARPGRAFANLCTRQPLPGGTDSINIPKVLTGTAVGVQAADNAVVTEVDLTDTFINAPVRTIAGQQSVAIQLIDQSPISFDEVIFQDLVSAHAAATDKQVLYGTGSGGQVLGVDLTPGIQTVAASSPTIQGVYSAIANAIQKIHTTRFLPPTVIVMHPRRWGWLLSLLDTTDRPLFLPTNYGLNNAAGILDAVASEQVVGQMLGLPVVTDPNIRTDEGSETPTGTEDPIYVLRASDLLLWESAIRSRALPEPKAATLTVLLQVVSYIAFSASRQAQSIVQIVGLPAPVFA